MQNKLSIEQQAKADVFRNLHQAADTFVMPCARDALSAIVFEELGFRCMGTTSGGVNWAQGRRDYVYSASRETMLEHYGAIARATSLPVSADLENGYGETARDVAETIRLSITVGLVGGSIEDKTSDPGSGLIDRQLAVERIIAARETADSTGLAYSLTARCEAYSFNLDDAFSETVERLNLYREAGADCLFAPGLGDTESLQKLVQEVDGPISFGMGACVQPLSVQDLSGIGVRRISTGGGLPRAMFSALRDASAAILASGSFNYLADAITDTGINDYIERHGRH